MKFLIAKLGFGTGCDYTIGCNMNWCVKDYPSLNDAVAAEVKKSVFGYDDGEHVILGIRVNTDDQFAVKRLVIVPFDGAVEPDLNRVRAEHNAAVDTAERVKKEASERAEFDRLQAKYGTKP